MCLSFMRTTPFARACMCICVTWSDSIAIFFFTSSSRAPKENPYFLNPPETFVHGMLFKSYSDSNYSLTDLYYPHMNELSIIFFTRKIIFLLKKIYWAVWFILGSHCPDALREVCEPDVASPPSSSLSLPRCHISA